MRHGAYRSPMVEPARSAQTRWANRLLPSRPRAQADCGHQVRTATGGARRESAPPHQPPMGLRERALPRAGHSLPIRVWARRSRPSAAAAWGRPLRSATRPVKSPRRARTAASRGPPPRGLRRRHHERRRSPPAQSNSSRGEQPGPGRARQRPSAPAGARGGRAANAQQSASPRPARSLGRPPDGRSRPARPPDLVGPQHSGPLRVPAHPAHLRVLATTTGRLGAASETGTHEPLPPASALPRVDDHEADLGASLPSLPPKNGEWPL